MRSILLIYLRYVQVWGEMIRHIHSRPDNRAWQAIARAQ